MLNDAKFIWLDVHQATISVVVLDGTGHLVTIGRLASPDFRPQRS
jgi:hypothetical protein